MDLPSFSPTGERYSHGLYFLEFQRELSLVHLFTPHEKQVSVRACQHAVAKWVWS